MMSRIRERAKREWEKEREREREREREECKMRERGGGERAMIKNGLGFVEQTRRRRKKKLWVFESSVSWVWNV